MKLYSRKHGGNLQRLEKQTKMSALKKFFVSYDVFTIFTSIKHREIPCEAKMQHKEITL